MRILAFASLCLLALASCHSRTATVGFAPSSLKDCGAKNVGSTIEVNWDATLAKPIGSVKVWISNKKPERTGVFASDPGTLWLMGDVKGSGVTGAWIFPGTTVTVTDAVNDDVLLSALERAERSS